MSMLSQVGIHPNLTMSHARDVMAYSRARRLGSGQSTVAYAMTFNVMPEITWEDMVDPYSAMQAAQAQCEDRVIRVSTNETGMRTTIAIAMKHQSDPYAPKVYETMELQDGFVCVMERLTAECRFLQGAEREERYGNDFDYTGRPMPHMRGKSPYVAELMRVVERHGSNGHMRWDTHDANFAMRGKQLVVLDPLYCNDRSGPLPEYRDENYRAPRPMERVNEAMRVEAVRHTAMMRMHMNMLEMDMFPRMKGFDPARMANRIDFPHQARHQGLVTLKRERDLHRLKQLDNLDPNRIKMKGF